MIATDDEGRPIAIAKRWRDQLPELQPGDWVYVGYRPEFSTFDVILWPCGCTDVRTRTPFIRVELRREKFATRRRLVAFWIGQCPRCCRVYWSTNYRRALERPIR